MAVQKSVQNICRAVWRLTLTGASSAPLPPVRCGVTLQHRFPHHPAAVTSWKQIQPKGCIGAIPVCRTSTIQATQQNSVYILPSRVHPSQPDLLVIGDLPAVSRIYDCPNAPTHFQIDEPSLNIDIKVPEHNQNNSPKEARVIMKIRRKKMKRHLLKKYRKRMLFTLRKQHRDRKRKKEAVFQAKLANIQQWGETFSAKYYVLEELEKARRGGFYINVLDRK